MASSAWKFRSPIPGRRACGCLRGRSGAGLNESSSSAFGLGDPSLSFTKEIAREGEWLPNLFWGIGWDSNFGQTEDGIDLGSGFKVAYKEGDVTTDIEDLGDRLAQRIAVFNKQREKPVEVWFEPGK